MKELSNSYRAVAAREREERKNATEHERHREHMKEMIEKYGLDIRNWPESKSKGKTEEASIVGL